MVSVVVCDPFQTDGTGTEPYGIWYTTLWAAHALGLIQLGRVRKRKDI
jgi:hypothetical protein